MKGVEISMAYLDEEILSYKRQEKRAKYNTLETGIYIKEEVIEFEPRDIPELNINVTLPKSFVRMPDSIAKIKYPAETRPQFIFTSLDTTINFSFGVYSQDVPLNQVKQVAEQMKAMLKKVNPANIFYELQEELTAKRALCWFNYKSYAIDDQLYSIMYLLVAEKGKILHGTFSCRFSDMNEWNHAALQVIHSVKVMDI